MPDYEKMIAYMLQSFNNETEDGRLYISYPMVESLKDCKKDLNSCFECEVYISENVRYKEIVGSRSEFFSIRDYVYEDWIFLIAVTVLKANKLVFGLYRSTDYQEFLRVNQQRIHGKQLNLFIRPRKSVVTLSSIPFFILGYYGEELYRNLNLPAISKNCSFFCTSP